MPRRNMNTNAITANIAAMVKNPLILTHVLDALGRSVLYSGFHPDGYAVLFPVPVTFMSSYAGNAGIAASTLPPTNGTNMVTMRYIKAPIAVVARICIGVD
jgi:hypothetical protein